MSDEASVELMFGGDARTFRLGIAELLSLEDSRECPALVLLQRLHERKAFIPDVSEVLRLGLIGGGMDHKKVRDLIERTIKPGAIYEHLMTAQLVLGAALMGLPEDEPGKDQAATNAPGQEGSQPPPSTDQAQS